MDNLEKIEELQRKIRAEIEVTKMRMLVLLGLFEVSPGLRKEVLEVLEETKDESSCWVGNPTHFEESEDG